MKIKRYLKPVLLVILIFFPVFSLWALDVGLLVEQDIDISAHGLQLLNGTYDYSGAVIPYTYASLGDNGEIVFSAGINYRLNPFDFVPELMRTEMTLHFGMSEIKLGRMPYSDPLGIIADGFFDGALFSFNTRAGIFSIGGWYTGLLYKTRAYITMTEDELQYYNEGLNYGDLENTYFAPSRVLSSLGWESLAMGGLFNIKLAILGQFDMSGADLNSQYFAAKIAVPLRSFIFDIGGCFELIENSENFGAAVAAEMGFTWKLPSRLAKQLSLWGLFSSGVFEDGFIGAFLPLTTIPQGNLLNAKLSGLSIVSLKYVSRLQEELSGELSASYFIRSDLGTYADYPTVGINSDGFFLGSEFFGRFVCSLSPDVQMNLGGGVFMPFLGDAATNADMLWRVEVNFIISVF